MVDSGSRGDEDRGRRKRIARTCRRRLQWRECLVSWRTRQIRPPGNANLPIGVVETANREIGVPGPNHLNFSRGSQRGLRMNRLRIAVVAAIGFFLSSATWAQPGGKGVDRLYVLDCGQGHANDESRWTVGVNVGKPIDISVSCYLIHNADGYFLWDTGISDAVASMPDGWFPGNNPATDIHWTRAKTLESQLVAIGVKPSDIRFVGISHTHPDHIGNAELFPNVTFLIQKAEYDYYFAPGKAGIAKPSSDVRPTFLKDHSVNLVQ